MRREYHIPLTLSLSFTFSCLCFYHLLFALVAVDPCRRVPAKSAANIESFHGKKRGRWTVGWSWCRCCPFALCVCSHSFNESAISLIGNYQPILFFFFFFVSTSVLILPTSEQPTDDDDDDGGCTACSCWRTEQKKSELRKKKVRERETACIWEWEEGTSSSTNSSSMCRIVFAVVLWFSATTHGEPVIRNISHPSVFIFNVDVDADDED